MEAEKLCQLYAVWKDKWTLLTNIHPKDHHQAG